MPDTIETLIEQAATDLDMLKIERVVQGYDTVKPPQMACQVRFPRLEFVLFGTYRNSLCDRSGKIVERDLARGDCLLLPPNSWNKIIWVGEFVGFSLLFGSRQLGMSHFTLGSQNNTFTNVTTRCRPLPANSPIYSMVRILGELQSDHNERAPCARLLAQAAIDLALRLLNNPAGEEPTKSLLLYQSICLYVHDNYARVINRDMVADHFGISTHYLSKLFHIHGQSGFTEYVMAVRLERARSMLSQTTSPLEEIAHACGFHDRNYFCRVFKNEFGRTPTEFRRSHSAASTTPHPFGTQDGDRDPAISEMLRR